jgi:hypothetical protein
MPKPGSPVALLVEGLADLRAHVESIARVGIVDEAAERLATDLEDLRVSRLDRALRFRVDLSM